MIDLHSAWRIFSFSLQVEKSLQRIQSGQCNPMYTSQQSVENKVSVFVPMFLYTCSVTSKICCPKNLQCSARSSHQNALKCCAKYSIFMLDNLLQSNITCQQKKCRKIAGVKTTCVLHQVGGVPGWQALLSAVGFRLDFSGGSAGLPAAVFFPTSDPGDRLQQCSNTLQSLLGTTALPEITFLSHVCHCD